MLNELESLPLYCLVGLAVVTFDGPSPLGSVALSAAMRVSSRKSISSDLETPPKIEKLHKLNDSVKIKYGKKFNTLINQCFNIIRFYCV